MTERSAAGDTGPPDAAPESGPDAGSGPETDATPGLPDEQEPTTTGTLFVMLLFLMALAGMWALMYMVLLER